MSTDRVGAGLRGIKSNGGSATLQVDLNTGNTSVLAQDGFYFASTILAVHVLDADGQCVGR